MYAPESLDLALFETRDHSEDALLLRKHHSRLKANEVVCRGGFVFGAKLHDREGSSLCSRIEQTDGLHRTERERHLTACGHHLDRQAPFEVLHLFERARFDLLCGDDLAYERAVSIFVERTIE